MADRCAFAALLAAALVAGGLVVCGLSACAPRIEDPASVAQADDMSLGNPNAKVRVVEYASASCPHCARWDMEVFPVFKAKYVDTGKVRYTLKEYLTEPAALSAAGFMLARCAGQDRYFPVLDAVFRGQQEMVETKDPRGVLKRIANGVGGMTDAQLEACFHDMAAEKALAARADRHVKVDKVTSTPTFIVNGRRIEGEMTLPELDAVIAKAAG
jgi:protein-disulfide isomerase